MELKPDEFLDNFNIVEKNPDFYRWEYKKDDRGYIAKQQWGCGESSKLVKFAKAEINSEGEAEVGYDFLGWIKAKFKVSAGAGAESVVTSEKKDLTYTHQMTFWVLKNSQNKVVFQVVIDKLSYCSNAKDRNSNIQFNLTFPENELDSFTLDHNWNDWKNNVRNPTYPFYISTMEDYYRLKKVFDRSGALKASEGVFKYENNLWDLILRQVVTIIKPSNT